MNNPKSCGIIGGGQLGMMLLEAAKVENNDVQYTILEAQEDCPARPLADGFIRGSLTDENALNALANVSDVLTWEIEHIGVDTLIELESQGKTIIPKPGVLKIIQDKGIQKEYFVSHGIPTAPFVLKNQNDAWDLDRFTGEKVVLKSRTGGYDGKGVAIVSKKDLLEGNTPFQGNVLIEQFAENVKELALIVAVDTQGNLGTYPAIDMSFNPQSNLVEFLYSPSKVETNLLEQAQAIAEKVVASFQSPGLFAVEMFITESNEVWVNEIAPRPHNSGHHSIEGFETSQFAQLNRILLGLELGSMALKCPSAMINIVGPEDFSGTYQLAENVYWETQKDVFVHMYGKSETRPNRKLGHVTVTAEDLEKLLLRAQEVQTKLQVIPS